MNPFFATRNESRDYFEDRVSRPGKRPVQAAAKRPTYLQTNSRMLRRPSEPLSEGSSVLAYSNCPKLAHR